LVYPTDFSISGPTSNIVQGSSAVYTFSMNSTNPSDYPVTMSMQFAGAFITSVEPFPTTNIYWTAPGVLKPGYNNTRTLKWDNPYIVDGEYGYIRIGVVNACTNTLSNPDYLYVTGSVTNTTTSTTSTSTTSTSTTSTTTAAPTTTSTTTQNPNLPVDVANLTFWNSCQTYTAGAVSWADSSGNGNSCIISGSTMNISGSLGIAFNGTNNFLTYPLSMSNQPSLTDGWTLQFMGSMYDEVTVRDLFGKKDSQTGWETDWEANLDRFVWRNAPGIDKLFTYSAPNVEATKRLYTFRYTYGSANPTIAMFVDGTLIASMAGGDFNWTEDTFDKLTFGFTPNTDATYFKGTVTDILLYKKSLSTPEIQSNYTLLIGKSCP
jgi:hypothetical protein